MESSIETGHPLNPKPALAPKPRLTPKPFSLQKNSTFRSINAPKKVNTAVKPTTNTPGKSETISVPKPTPTARVPKQPQKSTTSDFKPSPVSVQREDKLEPHKNEDTPDSSVAPGKYNPASQTAAPEETPKPLSPVQGDDAIQTNHKESTDSVSKSGQKEEKINKDETQDSVLETPEQSENGGSTINRRCGTRRILPSELTSKFESDGPALPVHPIKTVFTNSTKGDSTKAVSSNPEQIETTTAEPPNNESDEGGVQDEFIGGGSIKRRISRLFESSVRPEAVAKKEEAEITNSEGGVKERIKHWAMETTSDGPKSETKPQVAPRPRSKSYEPVVPPSAPSAVATSKVPQVKRPAIEASSTPVADTHPKVSSTEPTPNTALETSNKDTPPQNMSPSKSSEGTEEKEQSKSTEGEVTLRKQSRSAIKPRTNEGDHKENGQQGLQRDNLKRRSVRFGIVERDDGGPPLILGSASESSSEEEEEEDEEDAPEVQSRKETSIVPVCFQKKDDENQMQEEERLKHLEFEKRRRAEEHEEARLKLEEERKREEEERERERQRKEQRLREEQQQREEEQERERLSKQEVERQQREELERERLKELENERRRQREEEMERERQMEMMLQKQREEERERAKQDEERLRQEQVERERERLEVEKRLRLEEERERQRLKEEEKLIEEEKEREREKELELMRKRHREAEERDRDRLEEEERVRQEKIEKERLRVEAEERDREKQRRLKLEEMMRERQIREQQEEEERKRAILEEKIRQEEEEMEGMRLIEKKRKEEAEQVQMERQRLEELERKIQEEMEAKRLKELEEELRMNEERKREELLQEFNNREEKGAGKETSLISFDSEVASQTRETPQSPFANVSKPEESSIEVVYDDFSVRKSLMEVDFDDFSVKPKRWGSQAKAETSPVIPGWETSPEDKEEVDMLLPQILSPLENKANEYVAERVSPEPKLTVESPEEKEELEETPQEAPKEMPQEQQLISVRMLTEETEEVTEVEQEKEVVEAEGEGEEEEEEEEDGDQQETQILIGDVTNGTDRDTEALTGTELDDRSHEETPEPDSLVHDNVPEDSSQHVEDSPHFHSEPEFPVFPESTAPLLDNSAQRAKASVGKRRSRSRPSRSLRVVSAQVEVQDWRTCDSTDGHDVSSKQMESDSDEEQPKPKIVAPSSSSQRVPIFPGLSPTALIAQLKRRTGGGASGGGEETEEDREKEERGNQREETAPSPSQLSRSPRSAAHMAGAARVLPPIGGVNGSSSPAWLKELKSKKRLNQ